MADTVNNEVVATERATSSAQTNTYPSNEERVQKINDMYNASLNANKANLEAQYQQSLSNAQADKEAIGTSYEGQRNNLAAEYERQRRNNDLTANVNGLNTGAGSQMDLAQTANYQSNKAMLAKAQAQEEATADRNLTDLTTQYQIAVNDAIANNDYQKSAALLDEYNNQKADMQKQAETLAQYGDFSGYTQLGYSGDQVKNMSFAWLASNNKNNGDLAYLSGALDRAYTDGTITAEQYKSIHGEYPAGYVATGTVSGGGGGGGNALFYTGSSGAYAPDTYNTLTEGLKTGATTADAISANVRSGLISVDQGVQLQKAIGNPYYE